MSVSTEITRLQNARKSLQDTAEAWGLIAAGENYKTDELADEYAGVEVFTEQDSEVDIDNSITIKKGYHTKDAVYTIKDLDGDYTLTSKEVIPSTSEQSVVPGQNPLTGKNYYGLSSVVVKPIPSKYQDVTPVNVAAAEVLAGKTFVSNDGTPTVGTMINNGAVSKSLKCGQEYNIPAGYHDGSGVVSADSLASQTGVDADKTAIASATVLSGSQGWVNGNKINGTMANNGNVEKTINPLTQTSVSIPTGYCSGGSVTLTSDLEAALSAI